ncbi:J domain-containing protein [Rhabdothermincola sediminis]|uniref:J domain-containing protein n=1 Tax=Rhabdothermincola sediminis TaxID=2751370 RepID=UPI001AA0131B|nr:J domain-containing protein [Rhabdothermincola sediminis]
MSDPSPYEVLGVAPTASMEEIRRAYLGLARDAHPDLHPHGERHAADERMRRINAAWAIVGDERRRRTYDEQRRRATPAAGPRGGPSPGFVPVMDDDTDYAALLDQTPVVGASIPRWLQVLPAALWVIGLLGVVSGLVAGFAPLLAVGAIGFVLGWIAFAAAPALAVARSYRAERD